MALRWTRRKVIEVSRSALYRDCTRDPGDGIDAHREALAIHRQTGHRPGEAATHAVLADIYRHLGRHAEADDHRREVLV